MWQQRERGEFNQAQHSKKYFGWNAHGRRMKDKRLKDKIVLASNEMVDCISLINDVNTQNIAIVIIVIVKTDDGDIYQVILSSF